MPPALSASDACICGESSHSVVLIGVMLTLKVLIEVTLTSEVVTGAVLTAVLRGV